MISLPFNLNPIIKAYHPEAYLSGIIFSKDLKYYPYLLSHYIQLIYYANWEESGTRLNYNNRYENWMFTKDGLITLNMLELPGFMFTSKSFDICDIVISSLKAGYYMMGLYDEYYIPEFGNLQWADCVTRQVTVAASNRAVGLFPATEEDVLWEIAIPSARISLGYVTNAAERQLLIQENYQKKLAQGIAEAINEVYTNTQ